MTNVSEKIEEKYLGGNSDGGKNRYDERGSGTVGRDFGGEKHTVGNG